MPRVALVTGGSGALGQAITQRFLGEGAIVCVPWIVERERERLEASVEPAARGRLVLERCDVADDAAMARLAGSLHERYRRIDVLVSAVGGFAMGELAQTDRALWDTMLTVIPTPGHAPDPPHRALRRLPRPPRAGGRVRREVSEALFAGERSHVDDPASTPTAHIGQHLVSHP